MSRQEDLQKLIYNYGRRLQKLQEQQALMGLDTPPHILIEIEDVQAKIAELELKLGDLEAAESIVTSGRPSARPGPPAVSPAHTQFQPADGQTIFVGRQTQLTELERYWQEAYHQHRGKVVFLTGEAGIGKTSLVQQFSQAVQANYPNVQYAEAQCDQIAGDISPYAPFVQLLNSLTEQATRRGKHWSVEFIREIGPDILGMIPVAGPILATAAKSADFAWRQRRREEIGLDQPGQFGQQDIFQQFTDTFRNLARHKRPLLLFIDDWHWADTSSTNLLFHLARQLSDVPILLLATYRPHDAQARQHPILSIRTEMERYQLCTGVSLEFFSREDLIAYLARRFPQAQFEPAFVEWLLDITNGNALFVSEYVNLLVNQKLLTPDGQLGGDFGQVLPPANVEAVIRSRLGFLDQEARDMLAYGSVEGEQFTSLLLSRLLEMKPLSLLKRLRTIEETHQLITSLGQQRVYEQQTTVYRFIHTLIHHTLYNMLETEERVEINWLLLELLESAYRQVDQATKVALLPTLIYHSAEARQYTSQARYALMAAQNAASNYAHTEVIKYATVGLQALEQSSETSLEITTILIELLIRRSRTEDFIGAQKDAFATCYQAEKLARGIDRPDYLLKVLIQMGRTLRHLGDYNQALKCYEEAILIAESLGEKIALAEIFYGLGSLYFRQINYEKAMVYLKKALAIAEPLSLKTPTASAYNLLGRIHLEQSDYEEAFKRHYQSMAINRELEDKRELVWNLNNIGSIHKHRTNFMQALETMQEALETAREVNFKRGEAIVAANIGATYLKQGNYDQAFQWFQNALIIQQEIDDKPALVWTYEGLSDVFFERGNFTQALKVLNQALELNILLDDQKKLGSNYLEIGLVYQAQGDYSQALDHFRQALLIYKKLDNPKDIIETREHIAAVQAKLNLDAD